ncbi:VanZ family protein [Nocardioides lacusdianchii]|uniref:VanZ family protein n=1 Tax=Nocardioides lacusdianchii TaxID=2783664 RepID=UPI001CC9F8F8|nr:VanZ family protein [Nocardioides lacusdianchii]
MPASFRFLVGVALLAYTGALAYVLLTPSGTVPSGLVQDAMSVGARLDAPAELLQRSRVEFGLNVLAFVPLSFLGYVLRPSIVVSAWIAGAFAVSMLVEAIQTTMPERMATHSDVVANTAGAACGALAAWCLVKVLASKD